MFSPPRFREDGVIEIDLDPPIDAPGMRMSEESVSLVTGHVTTLLDKLEVTVRIPHAVSYRPAGGSFVAYKVSLTVPGTIPLRQRGTSWSPKRRKK